MQIISALNLPDLSDSDHCLLKFTIQRRVVKARSKAEVLDFRRVDFCQLRRLVGEALGSQSFNEMRIKDR